MSDDAKAAAREQGKEIEGALEKAKLKLVADTLAATKQGSLNVIELERLRKYIEALEYALTCVPSAPARVKMF